MVERPILQHDEILRFFFDFQEGGIQQIFQTEWLTVGRTFLLAAE